MRNKAKYLLVASFTAFTVAGAPLIYTFWEVTSLQTAVGRSALFVLAMMAIHVVGYAAYIGQFATAPSESAIAVQEETPAQSPDFLRVVLLQQVPILFLTALMLDGGMTFRGYLVGALAHWSVIGIILVRRRPLTELDVFLLRWGFIPLVLLSGLVARFVIR